MEKHLELYRTILALVRQAMRMNDLRSRAEQSGPCSHRQRVRTVGAHK